MLSPADRTLLVEALRPPPGFRLDRALGTTYTLDLLALLTTPLAFSFFSWEEHDDGMPADPLVLLNAVRENADRITLFCQAGAIQVPGRHRVLFQALEGSVVEVAPPREGGVFHPKVWVLRFAHGEGEVRYRLLVLSRNLTFDRSWDTVLSLDGALTDRTYAYARNHSLGDFVQALPEMAVRAVQDGLRDDVDRIQDEVRRVDFTLPPHVEDCRFWPLGVDGGDAWPFEGSRQRMLVVSPFLSAPTLERLTEEGDGNLLVGRMDEVDRIGPELFEGFETVYRLSPDADVEEEGGEDDADPTDRRADVPASGLHAKLYVSDEGWDARLWTGSANATEAAFGANVEFLVELRGRKSKLAIDEVLGSDDDALRLRDFLEVLHPPDEPADEDDPERALEARLRTARRALAAGDLTLRLEAAADEDSYNIVLIQNLDKTVDLDPEVQVRCWPISLQESAAAVDFARDAEVAADFGARSLESLTSFVAFELALEEDDAEVRSRFVLNLPLVGAPPDRAERMLEAVLRDRKEVLRFLLLLLQGEGLGEDGAFAHGAGFDLGGFDAAEWDQVPLLETLLKVLDRQPGKLDEVEAFLDDLRGTERGRELLPDGLDRIWEPIVRARREVGS